MLVLSRLKPLVLGVLVLAALTGCDTFTNSAQVGELETRNAQLQGTIGAIGTPASTIVALQMTADRALMLQAEMNNVQGTALAVQSTLTALGLGGLPQPTPMAPNIQSGQPSAADGGGGAPAGTTPSPQMSSSGTAFSNTTTATGVRDADGCAAGPINIFDTTEDQIFVVTTITNLKAGSTFAARWLANGSLYYDDTRCWIPNQDWDNVCAYCSIVPDTGSFEPGSWTVELLLDGQLLSQSQFQVVDNSGGDTTQGDAAATEAAVQ
jgi:hypothetical protein